MYSISVNSFPKVVSKRNYLFNLVTNFWKSYCSPAQGEDSCNVIYEHSKLGPIAFGSYVFSDVANTCAYTSQLWDKIKGIIAKQPTFVCLFVSGDLVAQKAIHTINSEFQLQGYPYIPVIGCSTDLYRTVGNSEEQQLKEHGSVRHHVGLVAAILRDIHAEDYFVAGSSLPSLSDMENAVLHNPPHLLMFHHPAIMTTTEIQQLLNRCESAFKGGQIMGGCVSCNASQFQLQSQYPLDITDKYIKQVGEVLEQEAADPNLDPVVKLIAEKARISTAQRPSNIQTDDAFQLKYSRLIYRSQMQSSGTVGLALQTKEKGGEVEHELLGSIMRLVLGTHRFRAVYSHSSVGDEVYLNNKGTWETHLKLPPPDIKPTKILQKSLHGEVQHDDEYPIFAFQGGVVYPGELMYIRVFEPRYRLMLKQCAEQDGAFGLAYDGIGCTSRFIRYDKDEDGSYTVVIQGLHRFKVKAGSSRIASGTFGLTLSKVEFFDDLEDYSSEDMERLNDIANKVADLVLQALQERTTRSSNYNSQAAFERYQRGFQQDLGASSDFAAAANLTNKPSLASTPNLDMKLRRSWDTEHAQHLSFGVASVLQALKLYKGTEWLKEINTITRLREQQELLEKPNFRAFLTDHFQQWDEQYLGKSPLLQVIMQQ